MLILSVLSLNIPGKSYTSNSLLKFQQYKDQWKWVHIVKGSTKNEKRAHFKYWGMNDVVESQGPDTAALRLGSTQTHAVPN